MTEAERRLWRALPELKTPNRFRRQHPIGRYVVDPLVRPRGWQSRSMAGNTHRSVS